MGPLIAAAAFEITGNWDAVPYTFAVIALLTIVGTLIFGSQMRALHSRNA